MNMRTIKNWRITFMSFIALSLTACTAQNGKPQQPQEDYIPNDTNTTAICFPEPCYRYISKDKNETNK